MQLRFYKVLFLVFLFASSGISGLSQDAKKDGYEIIHKSAAEYAKAETYQDVGVVQTISSLENPAVTPVNSFKTIFSRPNKFRFEWEEVDSSDSNDFNIVWSDGHEISSYSDLLGLRKEESLSLAIAGATGISRGAAHTIPTLLFSEVGGFRLSEMQNIALVGEENFEGENCYVVRGTHPFGYSIDVWISKSDLLMRKEREPNDDGTFTEEIRRNVKVGEPINSQALQFTPPSNAERTRRCLFGLFVIGALVVGSTFRKRPKSL